MLSSFGCGIREGGGGGGGGGGMVFQAKSEKLVCFLNAKSRNSGKTKSKWLCLCDETVESEKEARRKVFSALNSFYRLPKLCFNL